MVDIQNFALRAHCVCTVCMAFPLGPKMGQKCVFPKMIPEHVGRPNK